MPDESSVIINVQISPAEEGSTDGTAMRRASIMSSLAKTGNSIGTFNVSSPNHYYYLFCPIHSIRVDGDVGAITRNHKSPSTNHFRTSMTFILYV